jgi:alkane 1-monooxygenase
MTVISGRGSRFTATLRTFLLHSLAFILPLITLSFWLTGPHSPKVALLWLLPMLALYGTDYLAPPDRKQPREDLPNWPYTCQVYALAAIQIANYVLLLRTISHLHVNDLASVQQTLAMLVPTMFLSGTNAGYSGIVIAHEFVHRHRALELTLGRILLIGVFYEHFATEHVRGHHPRVGTAADPVTAHFGETHWQFVRRTVPAQFKSAWQLETTRIRSKDVRWFSRRMLQHRVLQGVVAETALLCVIAYGFGWLALVFFMLQAATAVIMLETVNYIEHWGLSRSGKKVQSVDSWDTDSWFTHYTLVGLSRHADHHAQASRPYQRLRHCDETAKMPAGYYGTVMKAIIRNRRYRELCTAELERKGLGPFRSDARASSQVRRESSRRPSQDGAVA